MVTKTERMGEQTAIVIGASMAGLLTARVLSERFPSVEIIERDQLDEDTTGRRGVPQGRHAHALLAAGHELLEEWFPGITAELIGRGASTTTGRDGWWFQGGSYKVREDWGSSAISMSRPLLETTVRRRVAALSGITVTSNAAVDRLVVEGDRVVGVVSDGVERRAHLVVDCSGRHSRFLDELAEAGFPAPPVSHVEIHMAYGTRILRRRPDDFDGTFAVVVGGPEHGHRMGVLLPMEDDRWILSVGGFHGDVPPTDEDGYRAFVWSLPSSVPGEVLDRAEVLSPVMTHRLPTSQRRHFERLRRRPLGFVALGDSVCSFNPVYGQGMSSAALQAEALGRSIDLHGVASPEMTKRFYADAAKVIDNPWTIAATADFIHPETTGAKPPGTDAINRYLARVQQATHVSQRVQTAMMQVQNLLAAPQTLMRPSMIAEVMRASRTSPARGGMPGPQPVIGRAFAGL